MLSMEEKDRIVQSTELKKELDNAPKQAFFKSNNKYLDQLIGGFAEGDLIVLGGNPKCGKTTLLQTWTRQFAEQGLGCLWFSVELSNREFISRFGEDLPIFYLPRIMPTKTTHTWIEKKILEAKAKHDIKFVFVDHIGMVADEDMYRQSNAVDVLDSRIFRLKRFALEQHVCLIAVSPLVLQTLRKKKTEPSIGDFRGTAMTGYTADTLMVIDRLAGKSRIETANDEEAELDKLVGVQARTDSYLYVIDSRRTGTKRVRVKMYLDEKGDYREYEP